MAGGAAVIYLDSAATTLQKPPEVAQAVARAIRTHASVGRGGHPAAERAAQTVFACRSLAAELFDAAPEQVVFTMNATHGLNLAIKTLVKRGERVIVSGYEHNAVMRPLHACGAEVTVVGSELFRPDRLLEELAQALAQRPSAVVCTHVSNVFGYILPIDGVAALCRMHGVPLVIDASQSAGTLPVSLEKSGAAFIAMPGHKGLYGPQGTGLLLCRESGTPLLAGGTGSLSRQAEMPPFLPDRLEAGTHNVPGAAGLLAGLRFLRKRGLESIRRQEAALIRQAAEGLSRLPEVQVYAAQGAGVQTGVLSFRLPQKDPGWVAEALSRRGIAVRAGLHCAPLAHATGGTEQTGTVRVSVSAFNTSREITAFLAAMQALV